MGELLSPDLTVLDTEGRTVRLRDLAAGRTLVIVFLRHFGWIHCRDTIAQLRERLDDIRAAGAELVLVGNGSVRAAARFQREQAPECAVFTDPSLETYRTLGMRRGVWATVAPTTLVAVARALLRGRRQTSVQGDPWQQGGAYVVARGGTILYAHANRNAADRPDVDAALAALRT